MAKETAPQSLLDLAAPPRERKGPLADRMRPETLDDFVGQHHLMGEGRLLRRAIIADRLDSAIFYGPPGTGKTSLAFLISRLTKAHFVRLNAVTSGVAEAREVLAQAKARLDSEGQPTMLLLDECHRWNKAQSDALLPAIEAGLIRFIGSTTENPMIAMTPAIVSRCRLFQFEPLTEEDILSALKQAVTDEKRGLGALPLDVADEALRHWAHVASGDLRMALNALELAALSTPLDANGRYPITLAVAEESIQKPVIRCDDTLFYDMLSAFCKSLRGSDSDAALLWFARLLYAGADPMSLARRIVAHASEDVGLANPQALTTAIDAIHALKNVGMPEARLALTQAILTICESPKSNSVVMAMDLSRADAEKGMLGQVPRHLRDTHYAGHERLENGEGYLYPHDFPGHYVLQTYLPEGMEQVRYYQPAGQGAEPAMTVKDLKAQSKQREK